MSLRRRLILVASLYAISLPLPAISFEPNDTSVPGYLCLICVPAVCMYPAWWANPLLLIGSVLMAQGYRSAPRACGWAALVLAATFLPQIVLMSFLDGPTRNFAEEVVERFRQNLGILKVGYGFWLASMAALILVGGRRKLASPLTDERQGRP